MPFGGGNGKKRHYVRDVTKVNFLSASLPVMHNVKTAACLLRGCWGSLGRVYFCVKICCAEDKMREILGLSKVLASKR